MPLYTLGLLLINTAFSIWCIRGQDLPRSNPNGGSLLAKWLHRLRVFSPRRATRSSQLVIPSHTFQTHISRSFNRENAILIARIYLESLHLPTKRQSNNRMQENIKRSPPRSLHPLSHAIFSGPLHCKPRDRYQVDILCLGNPHQCPNRKSSQTVYPRAMRPWMDRMAWVHSCTALQGS